MEDFAFKEIELTDDTGKVVVVLEDIGEGWNGDYNPEDPDDTPLVRFSVLEKDGEVYLPVDDASYCTQLSIFTNREQLEAIARSILAEVAPEVLAGNSVKRLCERLSWINV